MSEAILGGASASGNGLSWESIETVSNSSTALNLAIPASAAEYIFMYAKCSLNSKYTYTNSQEQSYIGLLDGSNRYMAFIFNSSVPGELAILDPGSYFTPVFSRVTTESGMYFIMDRDWTYPVGSGYFFGMAKLINSWGYCTGSIGQLSASFYGIKAPS